MAPKKQREEGKKEKLQAVVLTDDFETKFMPLSLTKPRCLLPLANVPLIEYTLEFLANSRVDEVYLMCSSPHSEKVQEYVKNSKWSLPWSPFKTIECIMSLEARSVGDCMRDLDTKSIITGDFLLLSGDVISNFDIEHAVKYHKDLKHKDKDRIVTMVTTEASSVHRSRPRDDPATFILDAENNKCIYYESISPINGRKGNISVDAEFLEGVDDFMIRNDLIDCHIDICSPIVPAIFTENFDFLHIRNDFTTGILTFDLLKRSIYVYIAHGFYGARVANIQTYRSITSDLIERYVYPVVPEINFLENTHYLYESNHIYKDANIVLSQSCKLLADTVIGAQSFVDERTKINGSVVGSNVKIGSDVKIQDSIIYDNVVIGDNTEIVGSIIGGDSTVKSSVEVLNSVIGYNCVIDSDIVVNGLKVVGTDDSKEVGDATVVGEAGKGFLYLENAFEDASDSDEDSATNEVLYKISSLALSDASISSVESKTQKKNRRRSSQRDSMSLSVKKPFDRSYSTNSQVSAEDYSEEFISEAVDTINRSIDNNHDIDIAVLELNTLRMSTNASYHDVRLATFKTLVNKIKTFVETETLLLAPAVNKVMSQWGQLFQRQVFEKIDELDLLDVVYEICERDADAVLGGKKFNALVLQQLYDLEVLDEENIIEWSKNKEQLDNKFVSQFVEWLSNADEESSEEDSDEE